MVFEGVGNQWNGNNFTGINHPLTLTVHTNTQAKEKSQQRDTKRAAGVAGSSDWAIQKQHKARRLNNNGSTRTCTNTSQHTRTHTHPHAPTRTESKTNKKLLLCADMHAAEQQSKEALGAVVSSTTTQTHNAQTHRPTQSSKHGVAVLVIVIVITASISTVHIEVQSDHRIPPAAVARAIRWRLIPSPPAPHHTPRLRRLHSTR